MDKKKPDKQIAPMISIIMPVFNTGAYLIEAINSVLNQQPVSGCELPSFELLIVDDQSIDQETIEILDGASLLDTRIQVFKNQRKKGAAGARNTGIMNARGTWIGFLDSDDIWFPNSLGIRWNYISRNANVRWAGAHFRLLKPTVSAAGKLAFESAESLLADLEKKHDLPELVCLQRPTREFGDSCMIGIMTVLIKRDLIIEKNLFNESLKRTEDYHLWFKCSFDNDLWMIKTDVAFYRIHSGSLTHGNQPKYFYEDTMIEFLLKEPLGNTHKTTLIRRFEFVMQDQCYFYREKKQFSLALKTALQWLIKRPLSPAAWKELVASGLRFG